MLVLPGGRQANVPVPANAYNGQVIRLEGQGEPSPYGGRAGALLVTINVTPAIPAPAPPPPGPVSNQTRVGVPPVQPGGYGVPPPPVQQGVYVAPPPPARKSNQARLGAFSPPPAATPAAVSQPTKASSASTRPKLAVRPAATHPRIRRFLPRREAG